MAELAVTARSPNATIIGRSIIGANRAVAKVEYVDRRLQYVSRIAHAFRAS
jgi:hypothetical protein